MYSDFDVYGVRGVFGGVACGVVGVGGLLVVVLVEAGVVVEVVGGF